MDGRRVVIVLAVSLGLIVVGTGSARAATPPSSRIAQAIATFTGEASVVVADPQTGFHYSWHADRVVPAASLYKLGVMAEAFRATTAGAISFDGTQVEVTDEDAGDDSYVVAGTKLSVRDAIERMITISDNAPARALVRLLGIQRINALTASLGLRDTRINYGLPADEQTQPYNTTSARDLQLFLSLLLRGAVVGPAESAAMLSVLQRQQIQDRLPAGLPEGATIAHKTGNLGGVAHDAGVIFAPTGPRIAVVLTTGFQSYDDVITLSEQVAAIAYNAELDAFAARYAVVTQPPPLVAQRPLGWTIQVTNASSFGWDASVYLRARLVSATASPSSDLRIFVPPLPPGGTAPIPVSVPGLLPGTYLLQLEVYDDDLGMSGNRLPIVFEVR